MSKVKRSLNTLDFHKAYKVRCKEKEMTPKESKEYRKIILAMGDVMSEILLSRGIIGMPWHIGDIFFKKNKPKTPMLDRLQSKIQQKKVYNYNEHTDGFVYLPFWLSPERKGKKRKQWCFSAFRDTKRSMTRLLVNKAVVYPDFSMVLKRPDRK